MLNFLHPKIMSLPIIFAAGIVFNAFTTVTFNQAFAAEPEWVSFHAAVSPPSAFQLRRAKKKGITLEPKIGTKIGGTLYLPNSDEKAPLVVLLHDCRGVRTYQKDWAKELNKWGYAAILMDSFKPRSVPIDEVCSNLMKWDADEAIAGRTYDVYGALNALADHPKIDTSQLAVLSWDRATALTIAAEANIEAEFSYPIKGAVALSPNCRQAGNGRVIAPLMILTGNNNDWWAAEKCRELAKMSEGSGLSPISITTYDGAYHSFDDPENGNKLYLEKAYNTLKPSTRGATLGYNAGAHSDAQQRVKSFFDDVLK
jgi:dienelactone hydrolase